MVEINRTTAALIILAIFISYPFVSASLFGFLFTTNTTNFSIYNTGWNGASTFKEMFENHSNQGRISTIVGSSNILNRINKSEPEMNNSQGSLIILGPAVHYDPTEALAILMYAINGGRVLIADDFGTANDILSVLSLFLGFMAQVDLSDVGLGDMAGTNMFGLNTTTNATTNGDDECNLGANFPIAGIAINGSLLADQGSYNDTPLTPVFHFPESSNQTGSYRMPAPWVTDFTTGLGGNGVIGNFASIISMKVRYPVNATEVDVGGGNTTCEVTFVTKWVPMGEFPASAASAFSDIQEDIPGIEIPDLEFSLQIAVLYSSSHAWLESDIELAKRDVNAIGPNNSDPYEWAHPNVGFPVFVYFPFPLGGELIICSDPSIFINKYLDKSRDDYDDTYDNYQFALNVVDKLMSNRSGQTIIFDEGHLANHPLSPTLPLSLYLKFLDMITMFPLFAWALPIAAIILSRRFMPKRTQAKPLLLTRVERYYGRSFFAVKMRWFLEYQQYSRGLELIYRRLKRNLNRRYNPDVELTPEITATYLVNEFPDRFTHKTITEGLSVIETIIETRAVISEQEFLDHYLFLKNIGVEIT
ncbi:MAG: DUF4350 domain-containing protein [Candidatus Heimdallarchaeota archaeon]|nr:MAG: DUF4350 domain-containing protein [Candidatus Heimdallarchaeota archaeon]